MIDMNCQSCQTHRSICLCAAGQPLHAAYTAALESRDAYHVKDHSDQEYYDAWLGQVKALRAYYAHQFTESLDTEQQEVTEELEA